MSAQGDRRSRRGTVLGVAGLAACTLLLDAHRSWVVSGFGRASSLRRGGTEALPASRHRWLALQAKGDGVIPVVDETDIEDDIKGKQAKSPAKSSSKTDDFESLMKAADEMAAKKKKQPVGLAKAEEDDDELYMDDGFRGLSVQDDSAFQDVSTSKFQGKRRLDLTVQGRFRQWSSETLAMFRKPNRATQRYVTILGSTIVLMWLIFAVTLSFGAIKFAGDIDWEDKIRRLAKAPRVKLQNQMDDYRAKAVTVPRLSDMKYLDEDGNDMRLQNIFPKNEPPPALPQTPPEFLQ